MDEVVRQIKLSLSDYNLKEHPSVKCTITYHTTVENVKLTPYTARTIKSLKIFDCTDNLDYRYKWADRNCFLPYSTLCHNDQEPLFFKNGLLTDTTYTNIVVEIKGRGLLTPAAPLLQGTRRQLYINQGIIKPADLSIDDCLSAENIHLINSMLPLGTVVLSPLSIS
ncbi:MAG: hypothetical protein Q4A14_04205 [Porphyromonas sp.]|nr:hypothetical protein [Porphyromonas sp.]